MILKDKEVLGYISKPYCSDEIDHLKKNCKEMRSYVTGKDAKNYLPQLPQFERDELKDERLKMMLSNVDLISRVMKPRNRIYSSKGGIEHFIIDDEKNEKHFLDKISNITQGLSLKDWIKKFAMRRNDYDPNGIVLVEKDKDGNVYPCFKSILDVHDRQLKGRTPEYLILKLCKRETDLLKRSGVLGEKVDGELFRCIDDTNDRICTRVKVLSTIPSFSSPVFPGIVSSDIYGDEDGIFYSPLDDVKDILKQYLLRSSLYNVVFARQAYSKEWMQKIDCPHCRGTGVFDGHTCQECHGDKVMLSQKHSDVIIIDYSGDENKNIPNPPMGKVESPVDTLEFFDSNLEEREDKIHYGIWGMYKQDKMSGGHGIVSKSSIGSNVEPTAYQAMLNSQPMVTQLVEFSKWYISIYKFVADIVGKATLGSSYKGSALMGGDRFMIESPDATWDRYLKARKAKAPVSELDSILTEYIENKYANNSLLYRKYILLLGVEPFLHLDIEEVNLLDIPYIQKMEKVYFPEWKNSISDWEFTVIADCINTESDEEVNPVKNLKDSLRKFTIESLKDNEGMPLPTMLPNGTVAMINSKMPEMPEIEKINI